MARRNKGMPQEPGYVPYQATEERVIHRWLRTGRSSPTRMRNTASGRTTASGGLVYYSAHTTTGLWIVMILMTIPAFGAPLFLIIAVTSLNLIVIIFGLLATALFTGGWLLGIMNLRRELRASRQRKLKGLPKPCFALSDDQARRWFEENPAGIPVTRENFPDSTRAFPAGAVRGL